MAEAQSNGAEFSSLVALAETTDANGYDLENGEMEDGELEDEPVEEMTYTAGDNAVCDGPCRSTSLTQADIYRRQRQERSLHHHSRHLKLALRA